MKIRYIIPLLAPALLMANSEHSDATDIIPRAINFFIFASILYYLLAGHARDFFKGRISGIADKLDSIQKKVNESNQLKKDAIEKVEEAKATAKIMIETSIREAQILSAKMEVENQEEVQHLEKAFKEKLIVEKRQMTREVVSHVLDEMLEGDSLSINKDELIKIVMKKVA